MEIYYLLNSEQWCYHRTLTVTRRAKTLHGHCPSMLKYSCTDSNNGKFMLTVYLGPTLYCIFRASRKVTLFSVTVLVVLIAFLFQVCVTFIFLVDIYCLVAFIIITLRYRTGDTVQSRPGTTICSIISEVWHIRSTKPASDDLCHSGLQFVLDTPGLNRPNNRIQRYDHGEFVLIQWDKSRQLYIWMQ